MASLFHSVSIAAALWMLAIAPETAFAAKQKCEVSASEYSNVGPALSIAEIESRKLEEMKASPEAPQVPFGFMNAEWEKLKAQLQPGDTIHEYNGRDSGGVIVVRDGCAIFHLLEWIA
jgi:hypothetical protein